MAGKKFALGLWAFSPCLDRFCTEGYKDETTLEQRFELASKVKDLSGVEVVHPAETGDLEKLKELFGSYKFSPAMIGSDVFSHRKWAYGSFASPDERTRREAIELTKKAMDVSAELKCNGVSLWLGQDGFDYPFQVNYTKAWDNLADGIRECADHDRKVTLFIEYKMKEPRTHCFISTVGKSLLLAQEIGRENIGITIDVGHALMAQENLAESLSLVHRAGRKLHVHFNDAYRYWDDDMIAGTIHFWEYLEFISWLERFGYDGWYSLDIYPYREDPVKACNRCIENLKWYIELVGRIRVDEILERVEKGKVEDTVEFLRKALSG